MSTFIRQSAFNVIVANNLVKSPGIYNIQKAWVLCLHYKKTWSLFRERNCERRHARNKRTSNTLQLGRTLGRGQAGGRGLSVVEAARTVHGGTNGL